MALSGLHVACCYGGAHGNQYLLPILSRPVWSENLTVAATTSRSATSSGTGRSRQAVFRVNSAVDAWISIGPTPDASNDTYPNARAFIQAYMPYDFTVESGDKLAWIAA